ncbi:TetR/AcrR family transcriptional regulator [Cohnella endophytica]|uniref:TetR/AcrR family transcriptional regulator n=1 Tax=Cohnella endophytica TaxID=2419778 RepID=A0A494XH68_9BACL|nr:TetR/AcrR family transcriptional regulator [Cohnella endophytica]RKP50087.1 TetR/AcrR family transcriptional regulator [Cohnella endophytica]
MQDKRERILDAAIHCFARKGFSATSIQEIVDELGMAKGSIYFYFKSKDELIISAIQHYGDILFDRSSGLPEEAGLPPREKLVLQLGRQFRFIREHLDFMRMMFSEPLTGMHPQIRELMLRLRARGKLWNASHLSAIYGSSIEHRLGDAVALFSGIVGKYLEALLFEERSFDEERLCRYLVRRLDDMVAGMERDDEAAILHLEEFGLLRKVAGLDPNEDKEETRLLQRMMDETVNSPGERDERTQADLLSALGLLKEESERSSLRNPFLARAMLALLKQHALAGWQVPLEQIEHRLDRLE